MKDERKVQARVAGVVVVFVDEKGHVIAHVADFEPQAPGGFTLREGQTARARRSLAHVVCSAYASPMLVRAIDAYDGDRIIERLCRLHGCAVREIAIGHDEENDSK